jgi:hypothetical protein
METIRNRPRVFLSYSNSDSAFIDALYNDLHNCHIEPWRDTLDIRHGEPWLDAIFESGIPTCDCVLVYLTDAALESPIVKKEIDAGILQKLKDKRVAFLPYVSNADVRSRLRADIQTLQSPEWNRDNYLALLPRVVAEIWHSYLDRSLTSAIQEEHTKRVETELALEQLRKTQEARPFSPSEEADFRFIWKCVDRYEPIVFLETERQGKEERVLKSYPFEIHIGSFVVQLASGNTRTLNWRKKVDLLFQIFKDNLPDRKSLPKGTSVGLEGVPDIDPELSMYGLLQPEAQQPPPLETTLSRVLIVPSRAQVFSDKMARFRYWLLYNECLPGIVKWRPGSTNNDADH